MGAKVTIVEVADRVLRLEDKEISTFVTRKFKKEGIKILTSSELISSKVAKNKVEVEVKKKDGKIEKMIFDKVISAVGVKGNVKGIGLENVGVVTDRGCVVCDSFCNTSVKGIYAIGDVAGPPMLAHKAEHEGVMCVEKIAGLNVKPINKSLVPSCTYTQPQSGFCWL